MKAIYKNHKEAVKYADNILKIGYAVGYAISYFKNGYKIEFK